MARTATRIDLQLEIRSELERRVRSSTTEQRHALRARVILAAAGGEPTQSIAARVGVRNATVSRWRARFAARGLAGLQDAPRSGAPRVYDADTVARILKILDEAPPPGNATWTGKLIAEALGDVSKDYVWSVLRERGISLRRRRSWCVSTDPEFTRKAADVVGMYLAPPENAIVVSVDEKPHIQALERAQGYLKLPNGKALTGFNHEYKRHGTTTLFAALSVATGMVRTGHYSRRRRVEFLDFMNKIVAEHPDKDVHVILDNLNTHKPKNDRWLARHPNVHLHYTPTHASWLNQIECWFSILSRRALQGASFRSAREVRQAIDAFVHVYNETAAPFQWTKEVVHSVQPKLYYADLHK